MNKRLYRSSTDKMLAGVAAGLAEYFGIDPVIIRVAFVVMFLSGGFGILAYIVLWIVVPYDYEIGIKKDFQESKDRYANVSTEPSDDRNQEGTGAPFSSDYQMAQENSPGGMKKAAAIILIIIGGLLLLDNLVIDIVFDNLGPVILIAAGVLILYFAKRNTSEQI